MNLDSVFLSLNWRKWEAAAGGLLQQTEKPGRDPEVSASGTDEAGDEP